VQWDADAEDALKDVPLLLRGFVRKKVEEFARARGADRITARLLQQARREIGPGASGRSGAPRPEDIERLESHLLSEQADKRRTRTYEVRVCAGAVGCPRSVIPVEAIADALVDVIEASGFPQHLTAARQGRPLLVHHRFHVSVAGCPNACSQPHIADFGVIGLTRPTLVPDRCTACGSCVSACTEDAVSLANDLPTFDLARCIGCGDCLRACPADALEPGPATYRLLLAGKLGRHPRLATDLLTTTDLEAVKDLLAAALDLLLREGRPGERLGALLARDETLASRLRRSRPSPSESPQETAR
jgi:anaerobic sulfite reductase subunit C